jgi:hypothetical protein
MPTTLTYQGALDLTLSYVAKWSNGSQSGPLTTKVATSVRMPTGTTDGSIDRAYYANVTGLGSAATTTFDLAGSLTDPSGATISFAEVVAIFVRNKSATAGNGIRVGPAASNGFGVLATGKGFWLNAADRAIIQPASTAESTGGGNFWFVYAIDGVPVTAGTGDQFVVTTETGASSAAFEILILGRSA